MTQETPQGKAVVAWISPGQTSMFFTTSLSLMLLRDRAIERHLVNIIPMHSGVNIAHARNHITLQFLDDNPTAEWLLWIDSDMEFAPDTMARLIESADPVTHPIVGGLCFGEDAETGLFPTIYKFQKDPDGHVTCMRLGDYPDDTMFEVAATGAAFLLIHRTALEAMREQNFNPVFPFFQELEMYDKPVGEDIAFCARARNTRNETWPNGIPTFVNTAVKIGHHKSHMLTADKFRRQQGRNSWAPPATERVQVIVPVLHRPQNAKPFMDSLRASTGMADVTAVTTISDDETVRAWTATGAGIYSSDKVTFAEKVNMACRLGIEFAQGGDAPPWVLIVGDDVVFRPGWLDQALAAAHGDRYHVIGTNDLGNPHVVLGNHATHILIRRSYIDEVGASWDGPGIVCHEGYGHWFVDNEIVTAAKQRDVWTSSRESVIEHLHPAWGKAPDDDTYRKGQETRMEDQVLFEKRLAEYAPFVSTS